MKEIHVLLRVSLRFRCLKIFYPVEIGKITALSKLLLLLI